MSSLEEQFDDAVRQLINNAAAIGFPLPALRQMFAQRGGVGTVRRLIQPGTEFTSGFVNLLLANRLDLTLEALILENPEFHALFSDEEMREFRRHLFSVEYPGVQDQGD